VSFLAPALPPTVMRPWPVSATFSEHPIRKTWNGILNVAILVIVGYIGLKYFAGLYYVLTQKIEPIRRAWNSSVHASLRHDIRDVGEGFSASMTAGLVAYSLWRGKSVLSRLPYLSAVDKRVERVERAIRIPRENDGRRSRWYQLLWGAVWVVIYAVPGFVLGRWFVHHVEVSRIIHVVSSHSSVWAKEIKTLTVSWPKKLIGIFCGLFVARRAARGLYDDIQFYAVRQQLEWGLPVGRLGRLLLPPGYLARYGDLSSGLDVHETRLSPATRVGMGLLAFQFLFFTGWGIYVFQYVATA
jgi:hypothetical protein